MIVEWYYLVSHLLAAPAPLSHFNGIFGSRAAQIRLKNSDTATLNATPAAIAVEDGG